MLILPVRQYHARYLACAAIYDDARDMPPPPEALSELFRHSNVAARLKMTKSAILSLVAARAPSMTAVTGYQGNMI